uniref:Uncharacterized protein n=1 Tax=Rhizophora mucronata TaxID=61149 RepID=A0A2P2PLM3_RHIMU
MNFFDIFFPGKLFKLARLVCTATPRSSVQLFLEIEWKRTQELNDIAFHL